MAGEDLDKLLSFFKNLGPEEAAKAFETIQNKSSQAIDSLGGLQNKANQVTQTLQNLGSSALQSLQHFEDFDKISLQNLTKNLARNQTELVNITSQIGLIGLSLRSNFKPEAFSVLGEAAKESTADIDETLESINKLLGFRPEKDDPLSRTVRTIENLIRLGDPTKQVEMGLIATSAASGELGDLLENVGEDLSGLTLKAEKYSRITYDLANASGLNQKQVSQYARQLMSIPGAMDTSIESFEKGIDDLHLLDAAMKIGTGTGIGFTRVAEDLAFQYQELGTTGREALEYTTRLSSVSQQLRLPLEGIRSYAESAAKSFRFLGDNTQGTLDIFERFAPALQEGGLGARAINDIIGDVSSNISQLGLAQKAFLSSQTGGPGGLQGGYQIDLLLKQGKVDQVYQKVEESLRKQFGGRIVTLEEAASDSRAAGQFTKQVQLLTQGPTKIASSEQEAYRLLDVFAKGQKTTGEFKSPTEAFESALKTGDALQERQTNILSKVLNEQERATQLASISAYNLTRLVAGNERMDLAKVLNQAREQSSIFTAETGKLISGEGYLEGGQEVKEVVNDFFEQFNSETKTGTNLLGGFFQNFLNLSSEKANALLPKNFSQDLNTLVQNTKNNTNQSQSSDKLHITVDQTCANCHNQIARTEATRIGKKLISQQSSNQAIAPYIGFQPGLE